VKPWKLYLSSYFLFVFSSNFSWLLCLVLLVDATESTAQDAYEVLVNFFAAFPEYKTNKFYVTGESYAGIYIPMLLEQIDLDPLGAKLNIVGAAIGNGCWGNSVGTCAFSSGEALSISSQFYFGHGMYSQKLHDELSSACGDFSRLSAACLSKYSQMESQIGNFDVYNIYDECGNDDRRRQLRGEARKPFFEVRQALSSKMVTVETADSFSVNAGYSQALNDYSCGAETAMVSTVSIMT
jgi:carboxypeptidase C (cathepsin A)